MRKVNIYAKHEIKTESREKRSYEIKLEGTDSVYHLEVLAPRIYKNIRRIFDIEDFSIGQLFGKEAFPHLDIKISAGKGGAFFLRNKEDPSILIKSMTPGEYQVMKDFTGPFYKHLILNPDTLICPIVGIYKLSLRDDDSIDPIYFMVMKSVFDKKLVEPYQRLLEFDLKGSTKG